MPKFGEQPLNYEKKDKSEKIREMPLEKLSLRVQEAIKESLGINKEENLPEGEYRIIGSSEVEVPCLEGKERVDLGEKIIYIEDPEVSEYDGVFIFAGEIGKYSEEEEKGEKEEKESEGEKEGGEMQIKVNGVNVYTDKEGLRIVNNVAFFDDGSSVNIETREIVNKGEGYISFSSKEEVGKKPKSFVKIEQTRSGGGATQEAKISGGKGVNITQRS